MYKIRTLSCLILLAALLSYCGAKARTSPKNVETINSQNSGTEQATNNGVKNAAEFISFLDKRGTLLYKDYYNLSSEEKEKVIKYLEEIYLEKTNRYELRESAVLMMSYLETDNALKYAIDALQEKEIHIVASGMQACRVLLAKQCLPYLKKMLQTADTNDNPISKDYYNIIIEGIENQVPYERDPKNVPIGY